MWKEFIKATLGNYITPLFNTKTLTHFISVYLLDSWLYHSTAPHFSYSHLNVIKLILEYCNVLHGRFYKVCK